MNPELQAEIFHDLLEDRDLSEKTHEGFTLRVGCFVATFENTEMRRGVGSRYDQNNLQQDQLHRWGDETTFMDDWTSAELGTKASTMLLRLTPHRTPIDPYIDIHAMRYDSIFQTAKINGSNWQLFRMACPENI